MQARPPPPEYTYLLGLIDDTGIYEHSRYGVPRREHGYTSDDATRALIVLCQAPPDEAIGAAQRVLLAFLLDSVTTGGTFRNRLGFDRQWRDEGDCGDTQGRGIWALATAAVKASEAGMREAAMSVLDQIATPRSRFLRPLAYASLGGNALWRLGRRDPAAFRFGEPALISLRQATRPWPEPRLTYANGRIPAAMLAAGEVFDDADLIEAGLRALEWLVEVETAGNGWFGFTPVRGWAPGEPRARFDQQPIEAAAMSDACERAWLITRENLWRDCVLQCGAWLMGANDVGTPLYDPDSGATRDGLTPDGVNANSGAESTISGLMVLQACQRVADARHQATEMMSPLH